MAPDVPDGQRVAGLGGAISDGAPADASDRLFIGAGSVAHPLKKSAMATNTAKSFLGIIFGYLQIAQGQGKLP